MVRAEYSEATVADLVDGIAAAELAEEELDRLRDIECLARELTIALRTQHLIDPHRLGVNGCAAAVGLERMFETEWASTGAVGLPTRLLEEVPE